MESIIDTKASSLLRFFTVYERAAFWFNFIRSLTGWAVSLQCVNRLQLERSKFSFTASGAVPLLVGLVGITGLLPRALWAFSDLAGEMAKKLAAIPERKQSNKPIDRRR